VLQIVVNENETAQENESLNDDKIIAPLKESVSEVEKLVRAGVYGLTACCVHWFWQCYRKFCCKDCVKINKSWPLIVRWKEHTFPYNLICHTIQHIIPEGKQQSSSHILLKATLLKI
jgi:hypothetical protein